MKDLKKQLLKALNLDREGDWDAAHSIVQKIEDANAHWIHAYLHRKEGALGNSRYWYNRSSKPMPDYSLDREWEELHEYMTRNL